MEKRWYESKTVWTGVSGLVAAAAGYLTGEVPLGQALQMALTALIGIFIRTGMMGPG